MCSELGYCVYDPSSGPFTQSLTPESAGGGNACTTPNGGGGGGGEN